MNEKQFEFFDFPRTSPPFSPLTIQSVFVTNLLLYISETSEHENHSTPFLPGDKSDYKSTFDRSRSREKHEQLAGVRGESRVGHHIGQP
jgi:hypothetical protein